MGVAACGSEVYVLQARPITGSPKLNAREARQVWTNINTGEILPISSPITWSLIAGDSKPAVVHFHVPLMGLISDPVHPLAGLVAGRPVQRQQYIAALSLLFSATLGQ